MQFRHFKGGIYDFICAAKLESDPDRHDDRVHRRRRFVLDAAREACSFEMIEHDGRIVQRFTADRRPALQASNVYALIIEDNPDIVANLYGFLEPLGYTLDVAHHRHGRCRTGEGIASRRCHRARSGIAGTRWRRSLPPAAQGVHRLATPILMLTARDTVKDKLTRLRSRRRRLFGQTVFDGGTGSASEGTGTSRAQRECRTYPRIRRTAFRPELRRSNARRSQAGLDADRTKDCSKC
jgi:CheY-like chemotaxis protein